MIRLDGPLETTESGLAIGVYDAVDNLDATADTDVYKFYVGGLSGVRTCTITIVYTDSTKSQILTVEKTVP